MRLTAHLHSDAEGEHPVWFELPAEHGDALVECDWAWLLLMLPVGAVTGEDICLKEPIDPVAREHAHGLLRLWSSWYRWACHPGIDAPRKDVRPDSRNRGSAGSAVFFSGGVDSFATALRLKDRGRRMLARGERPVLVSVHGFDIPLDREADFSRVEETARIVATEAGWRQVSIATNLRELVAYNASWGQLSHGVALGCIAHLLSGMVDRAFIASTYDYGALEPWGSHPLSDPLMSSSALSIVHEGACLTRIEKTKLVAADPAASSLLRVCWASQSAGNCSRCGKCVRTMATLDLLGAAGKGPFEWDSYDLERVRRVYLGNPSDVHHYQELCDEAYRMGRHGLARALQQAILRSRRLRSMDRALARLGRVPYLWRHEGAIRAWLRK